MFTVKYDFKDTQCESFIELIEAIKIIPDNSCFSIVDKRESLQSVVFLDKKNSGLFESYGEEKEFDIENLTGEAI